MRYRHSFSAYILIILMSTTSLYGSFRTGHDNNFDDECYDTSAAEAAAAAAAGSDEVPSQKQDYMDPYNRPSEVQDAIDRAFRERIRRYDIPRGRYFRGVAHGSTVGEPLITGRDVQYQLTDTFTAPELIQLDEVKIACSLYQSLPDSQDSFNILVLGGDLHNLAKSLSDLKQSKHIPVNIYFATSSKTAETYAMKDICVLSLQNFNVDNVSSELAGRRILLTNQTDMIITMPSEMDAARDSVGLFVQLHDLLRPISGVMIGLAPFFLYTNYNIYNPIKEQFRDVLFASGAEFLTLDNKLHSVREHFALRRVNREPLTLAMHYEKPFRNMRIYSCDLPHVEIGDLAEKRAQLEKDFREERDFILAGNSQQLFDDLEAMNAITDKDSQRMHFLHLMESGLQTTYKLL